MTKILPFFDKLWLKKNITFALKFSIIFFNKCALKNIFENLIY